MAEKRWDTSAAETTFKDLASQKGQDHLHEAIHDGWKSGQDPVQLSSTLNDDDTVDMVVIAWAVDSINDIPVFFTHNPILVVVIVILPITNEHNA